MKHILVILMIVIALYRALALGRKPAAVQGQNPNQNPNKKPGGQGGPKPATAAPSSQEKLSVQLLYVNAGIAVVVLLLSAFVSALAGV